MKRIDKGRSGIMRYLEGISLLQRIPADIRRNMLQAALSAGLGMLIAGGLFGGINRGFGGLIIGAASGLVLGALAGAVVGGIMGTFMPQNHARAEVTVALTDPGGRYAPGETIHGYAQVDALNSFRVSAGSVYFMCRGFYLHATNGPDEDPVVERQTRQYLAQRLDLTPAITLRRGSSTRYPFELIIPEDGLPTHHGYACAVRWSVHFVVETPSGQQVADEHEIMVEVSPPAVPASPGGYQATVADASCQISISLDRAVCAEGQQVIAKLNISPIESFEANEVRLLLLRIENTTQGNNQTIYVSKWDASSGNFQGEARPGGHGTTYVWLEDEVSLSGPTRFEIAEPDSYSAKLTIPAQWRPSLATKDGSVAWKVVATIARPRLGDLHAVHEVVVYTGSLELAQAMATEPAARRR